MSREAVEREGDIDSEAGSRFWAASTEPDVGLEPANREIATWAKVRRLTDWATQALPKREFLIHTFLPQICSSSCLPINYLASPFTQLLMSITKSYSRFLFSFT